MFIKCWGSRGSIPVSGREYLRFGGDTTCIQVTAASGETVIIDAGTGIRKLGAVLQKKQGQHFYLLMTHVHWDHVAGFSFFKPLLDRNCTITIQNLTFSGIDFKSVLERIMSPPLFPITLDELNATICFDDTLSGAFSIGSIDIETIPLSHPNGGMGYRFTENNRSFVFLTDNELSHVHPGGATLPDFLSFTRNADLLFHDAEFKPDEYPSRKCWGHSAYTDVLDLAIKAGVRQLGLFHLNQDRTDDQVDAMEKACQAIIRQQASSLDCFAVASGMEFTL